MSLIDCPECGKRVSASVPICPHCSHPIAPVRPPRRHEVKQRSRVSDDFKIGCAIVLVMIVLLFATCFVLPTTCSAVF
jgi:uncharacterized membrane protein YvbJ